LRAGTHARNDIPQQGEIKKLQEAASKQEKARAALAAQVEEINAGLMAAAQVGGGLEH
jgi:hypothetical protein